jgi:hypothetical protein
MGGGGCSGVCAATANSEEPIFSSSMAMSRPTMIFSIIGLP